MLFLKSGEMKNRFNLSNKEKFIGEKFFNNLGERFTIIEYFNNTNLTVRFDDGTTVLRRGLTNIQNKQVLNPNSPVIYNIGFFGQGKYSVTSNKKSYFCWVSMLSRCYSSDELEKYPTYKGCSVVKEWHNFQNFAKWFEENFKPEFMLKWHLDKDLLISGNKIYGPETCCFLPPKINLLFSKKSYSNNLPRGVFEERGRFISQCCMNSKQKYLGTFDTPEEAFQSYKIVKENYIKSVADEFREQLTPESYQAMYNYQV